MRSRMRNIKMAGRIAAARRRSAAAENWKRKKHVSLGSLRVRPAHLTVTGRDELPGRGQNYFMPFS